MRTSVLVLKIASLFRLFLQLQQKGEGRDGLVLDSCTKNFRVGRCRCLEMILSLRRLLKSSFSLPSWPSLGLLSRSHSIVVSVSVIMQ
mmetsp:Transcript_26952/g.55948  ORF Transcript_26952/g.55948 Transcript_26952/m.55948 type:complete len:88 (+) Transcript_26952:1162-1425(+)